jgi:hypothetical protein
LVSDGNDRADPSFSLITPEFTADVPIPEPGSHPGSVESPRSRRRELRDHNSSRVRTLVHLTGKRHAEVNSELNRRVGIRRVTEATVAQLERRLRAADGWLQKLI